MGFTGSKDSLILDQKNDRSIQCNENFDKLNELEISQKLLNHLGENQLARNAELTRLCRDIKLSIVMINMIRN